VWRRYLRTASGGIDVDRLVTASEYFTPADIEFAARKGAQAAFEREMLDGGGRPATTRWRTIGGLGLPAGVTAVDLMPVTGRSHQLRVHLAWLGCPILGDRLYGPPAADGLRLWLHAAQIVFPHPCGGHPVTLRAPLCLDR
jgi:23S rRNA-/tRNA-specific pseudouridylate synthase